MPFKHVWGIVIQKGIRPFFYACSWGILWFLWHAVQGLLGSAIIDWVDGQIAEKLGITSPTLSVVIQLVTQIGPPLIFTALLFFLYHKWLTKRALTVDKTRVKSDVELTRSLQIIIGSGSPFETVEAASANRRRIVRVKIQNNTDAEISNGKLDIFNLDPPNSGVSQCALKGDIVIGPKGHQFVDVASYDIGSSQAHPGSHIRLIVPVGGGFFAEAYAFANLPLQEHTFHLRVSRFTEVYDEVFCALTIDSMSAIHLENRRNSAKTREERLSLDLIAAHTEELRLQRKERAIENNPIQQALKRAFAPKEVVYHRTLESPPPRRPVPDMSIRELFNYIDPDQLDNPHWATWAKVGRDVMDKLSTSQISAWGRVLDSRGATRPLTRIGQEFWDFAEWTYDFFADGMDLRVHARDRRGALHNKSYLDIRFNHSEVTEIRNWPLNRSGG